MDIKTIESISESDFNIILEKDYLSELERSVISNDYNKILLLLAKGSNIYILNKNNLCNGYLFRKYRQEHKCIKNICFKIINSLRK